MDNIFLQFDFAFQPFTHLHCRLSPSLISTVILSEAKDLNRVRKCHSTPSKQPPIRTLKHPNHPRIAISRIIPEVANSPEAKRNLRTVSLNKSLFHPKNKKGGPEPRTAFHLHSTFNIQPSTFTIPKT